MDQVKILGVTVRMGGEYPTWDTEPGPTHWRLGEGGRVQWCREDDHADGSAWVSPLPDLELILSVAVAYSIGYTNKRAAQVTSPMEDDDDDGGDEDGCREILDDRGYTVGCSVSARACQHLTDQMLKLMPEDIQPQGPGESPGSYARRVARGQRLAAIYVTACLRAYLAGSDHLQDVMYQGRDVSRRVLDGPVVLPLRRGDDHAPAG